MTKRPPSDPLQQTDTFPRRHIGPSDDEVRSMLDTIGIDSLDALADAAIPSTIRLKEPLDVGPGRTESEAIDELLGIARKNDVRRSFIGMGYHATLTPPVIARNILENPGWYTQYTPYQAEISQGRLEALLVFQTMVSDLTGLPLANASLLDEATAAAEAMAMCYAVKARGFDPRFKFFVSDECHPQTIGVVRTRARAAGVEVVVGDVERADFGADEYCGVLAQYPTTDGTVRDYSDLAERVHDAGAQLVVATDLLALTMLRPPGEFGADIAVGSSQRFGVPMGLGGPHAAFISTHKDHARRMPGRIIGISRDTHGDPAYRMAIQTREQHIKRERATSNICTAQALLAIVAAMYAVYHGPEGLRRIASRTHIATNMLATGIEQLGHEVLNEHFFDTIRVRPSGVKARDVLKEAARRRINLRDFGDGTVGIALDETVSREDVQDLLDCFGGSGKASVEDIPAEEAEHPRALRRESEFLTHETFNRYHSETEMLRFLFRLQSRDLSLAQSMIPLGSCTMKLNATSEMLPISWPEFANIHPFAPAEQWEGYRELFSSLERMLAEITGFHAVSLQPNAGSQGEYAGLLVIKAFHEAQGQSERNVCLIPTSAHGTNPASAITAGFRVVPVNCDEKGNIDIEDLRAKCEKHADTLGAIMITYPSTHGVFEKSIKDICAIVHEHGGQVYLDGANLNAQVGLTNPAECGSDVCHLNLHKTFCIPHGGGGPGMGPIGVAEHLAPFLPTHPLIAPDVATDQSIGAISAAPYGSPLILPISWMYIRMMGSKGLTDASLVSILNANYMMTRLKDHYPIVYTGESGLCAHEFILDLRPFDRTADIKADDVAKRLMDYGFHAPTMSWPVAGTLMIEPTESESKEELDRFCDAMISIREEIRAVEEGRSDKEDNPLKHAPHTAGAVCANEWPHPYPREQAAFPDQRLRSYKFWPPVGRIDNPWGDRNLVCACTPMEDLDLD